MRWGEGKINGAKYERNERRMRGRHLGGGGAGTFEGGQGHLTFEGARDHTNEI